MEKLSGGELQWTDAMLYPVLHRMERDGLIISEWVKLENGRKRKYYQLTELGIEEQAAEKKQWIKVHQALVALWGQNTQIELG